MRFGKFDVRYIGAVLAGAMAVLIIVSQAQHRGDSWWGAWGGWIGGIGSAAAAVAAVWVAVAGWRRSDREAADRQERELASKVAIWIEQASGERQLRFVVKYINGGGMPIYNAEATVTFRNGPMPYIDGQLMLRPTLGPEDFARNTENFHKRLLAALLKEQNLLRAEQAQSGLDDVPPSETPILLDNRYLAEALLMVISRASIRFAFTDANRVRWVREANGRLHRADTD
jgi:hypothetical protein